jgi:hypothetical protein
MIDRRGAPGARGLEEIREERDETGQNEQLAQVKVQRAADGLGSESAAVASVSANWPHPSGTHQAIEPHRQHKHGKSRQLSVEASSSASGAA